MNNLPKHTVSSGNVFADLQLDNPEERLAHARLGAVVFQLLEERGLKQREIAELLGINQSEVSRLMNGHFHLFSTDKLLDFLKRLNQKVTISVRERQQGEAFQEVHPV